MSSSSYPRTLEEVRNDIEYSRRLHELHCTLFKRLSWASVVVSLIAGTTALFGFVSLIPHGLAVWGLIVTVVTILSATCRWDARAAQHSIWRKAFAELLAASPQVKQERLDRQFRSIDANVDDVYNSVRWIAYNDTVISRGYSELAERESLCQRAIRLLL